MQPDTMKLVKAWICILQCMVILRSSTNAKTHVEHFNCNDASGTYLISGNSWGKQKSASAPSKCTLLKYVLITPQDVGDTCVQDFMKHLSNRLGENITVWANDTSSLSCYKNIPVQCPATAVVICKNNLPAAALGQLNCTRSVTLNNGVVTYPSGTAFPSEAIFDCDSGYYLDTTKSRRCSCSSAASWYWPKPPAECKAYNCLSSLSIHHGTFSGNAPVFNASCNPGYKLIGEPSVTCTSDSGSTQRPICLQIKCGAPPIPVNGLTHASSYNALSKAFYSCNSGYTPQGDASATCEASGNWSGTPPMCTRVACLSPQDPSNGNVSYSSHKGYDIATFSCRTDYKLVGQS
eukprot:scpid89288/ scgid5140/ Sushi, von Willebrand factor type A, EGF and pentraxin domain-containing protein 1; Polydom